MAGIVSPTATAACAVMEGGSPIGSLACPVTGKAGMKLWPLPLVPTSFSQHLRP